MLLVRAFPCFRPQTHALWRDLSRTLPSPSTNIKQHFSTSFSRWLNTGTKDVNLPLLTMYTKSSGCSLCDDAKLVLAPVMDQFNFEEVHIDNPENTEWFDQYRYDIPVFHLNGKFLMKHKVSLKLLLHKLDENKSDS